MIADSVSVLVKTVGDTVARNIVQSQVVYPKTKSLQDNALHMADYSAKEGLKLVIDSIEASIELKAVDAIRDAVDILKLMDEFRDPIMLAQADYIVIYKGGFDILKLKNVAMPESGRSIYVEVNSCRNEIIRYIQTARAKNTDYLQGAAIVGFVVLSIMLLIREVKK